MWIQDIIGELLYIGIVAEKGRCYGVRWKFGYKKTIKKHIIALNELQKCLQLDNKDVVRSTIENFIVLCEKNYEIGKFYNFSIKKLEKVDIGENYKKINLLIDKLFLDLLTELNKTYINKKKVYVLLCALHNLPRVYLGKNKKTLCNLNQEGISEQDAIKYSFSNMDSVMIKKYQNL